MDEDKKIINKLTAEFRKYRKSDMYPVSWVANSDVGRFIYKKIGSINKIMEKKMSLISTKDYDIELNEPIVNKGGDVIGIEIDFDSETFKSYMEKCIGKTKTDFRFVIDNEQYDISIEELVDCLQKFKKEVYLVR